MTQRVRTPWFASVPPRPHRNRLPASVFREGAEYKRIVTIADICLWPRNVRRLPARLRDNGGKISRRFLPARYPDYCIYAAQSEGAPTLFPSHRRLNDSLFLRQSSIWPERQSGIGGHNRARLIRSAQHWGTRLWNPDHQLVFRRADHPAHRPRDASRKHSTYDPAFMPPAPVAARWLSGAKSRRQGGKTKAFHGGYPRAQRATTVLGVVK